MYLNKQQVRHVNTATKQAHMLIKKKTDQLKSGTHLASPWAAAVPAVQARSLWRPRPSWCLSRSDKIWCKEPCLFLFLYICVHFKSLTSIKRVVFWFWHVLTPFIWNRIVELKNMIQENQTILILPTNLKLQASWLCHLSKAPSGSYPTRAIFEPKSWASRDHRWGWKISYDSLRCIFIFRMTLLCEDIDTLTLTHISILGSYYSSCFCCVFFIFSFTLAHCSDQRFFGLAPTSSRK